MSAVPTVAALAACLAAACTSASDAPPPPGQGWMATLDDAAALSELSIPGTHESLALYELPPTSASWSTTS